MRLQSSLRLRNLLPRQLIILLITLLVSETMFSRVRRCRYGNFLDFRFRRVHYCLCFYRFFFVVVYSGCLFLFVDVFRVENAKWMFLASVKNDLIQLAKIRQQTKQEKAKRFEPRESLQLHTYYNKTKEFDCDSQSFANNSKETKKR